MFCLWPKILQKRSIAPPPGRPAVTATSPSGVGCANGALPAA
nr:MAG TPA: hypothetical protein [Caudoviricetes sp.]